MEETLSILIVGNQKLVREAWSFMLNSDSRFKVMAETGDPVAAVRLAAQIQPSIVLLDIHLWYINDYDTGLLISQHSPDTKILGVIEDPVPMYARKMIKSGASGCITKNSSGDEMVKAILEISEGREYICDEIKDKLAEVMISGKKDKGGINSLSHREIEVIGHIKSGQSSREIASRLKTAVKTIEAHRYNILKKLGLKNVASLVNYIHNYQLELEERAAM